MKPFLADPSYPRQYFRSEEEKTNQTKNNKQQQQNDPLPPKKNPKCQIQILRYETNWNRRKILIAIFIKYEIWEVTDSDK